MFRDKGSSAFLLTHSFIAPYQGLMRSYLVEVSSWPNDYVCEHHRFWPEPMLFAYAKTALYPWYSLPWKSILMRIHSLIGPSCFPNITKRSFLSCIAHHIYKGQLPGHMSHLRAQWAVAQGTNIPIQPLSGTKSQVSFKSRQVSVDRNTIKLDGNMGLKSINVLFALHF